MTTFIKFKIRNQMINIDKYRVAALVSQVDLHICSIIYIDNLSNFIVIAFLVNLTLSISIAKINIFCNSTNKIFSISINVRLEILTPTLAQVILQDLSNVTYIISNLHPWHNTQHIRSEREDDKCDELLCQMRKIKIQVGGMSWPQTGATHYHAVLGLPDKGREIRGLVV